MSTSYIDRPSGYYYHAVQEEARPAPVGQAEAAGEINKWVVKLKFKKGGKNCTGTGFYINLGIRNNPTPVPVKKVKKAAKGKGKKKGKTVPEPDAKPEDAKPVAPWNPPAEYDVILTAAHNLYDDTTGTPVQDLVIIRTKEGDPASGDGTESTSGQGPDKDGEKLEQQNGQGQCNDRLEQDIKVSPDDTRYCSEYTNPGNTTQEKWKYDYGVILVKPQNGQPHPGFGFSLQLALQRNSIKMVSVTGFVPSTPFDNPINMNPNGDTTNTKDVVCSEDTLSYDMETIAGNSGSPVWVSVNNHKMVVAIHNNGYVGSDHKIRGAGARLSLETYITILDWVKAGWRDVVLSAYNDDKEKDVYLHFKKPPIRVPCLGHLSRNFERHLTTFRVMPAYMPSGVPDAANERWVLYYKPSASWGGNGDLSDTEDLDDTPAMRRKRRDNRDRNKRLALNWVRWRTQSSPVELVAEMTEGNCLFSIVYGGHASTCFTLQIGADKFQTMIEGPNASGFAMQVAETDMSEQPEGGHVPSGMESMYTGNDIRWISNGDFPLPEDNEILHEYHEFRFIPKKTKVTIKRKAKDGNVVKRKKKEEQ